jgi:membrane protease subunit HflK
MSILISPPIPTVAPADASIPPRSRRYRHILGYLFAAWLLSGIYIVQTDQQGLVTQWGRVVEPRVFPGIHYALPWPIDTVYKLKVRELRRRVVGGEIPDSVLGRTQAGNSEFFSGDQNLLNIRVVTQYSVSNPRDFLFAAQNADQIVGLAVESELVRRVAHTTVDDILTTQKLAIQSDVLRSAQKIIDGYRTGALLSSINIESVSPPPETAEAFRNVAGARSDAFRIVNEADGYSNDLLPRARGEADQLLDQAHSYSNGKINRAEGDGARFAEVVAQYSKAPQVTSTRVYLEAMELILPRLKKLIVDANTNLDLSVIGRQDNSSPSATATGAGTEGTTQR